MQSKTGRIFLGDVKERNTGKVKKKKTEIQPIILGELKRPT